ncbi:MAG TPA: glycerol-3-phosphate dehydrogenase C-terminal domain-containing protein, partial [Acidimicrobiales bacterium]|nr:glycerol-3-phosphate dehydrogenase C-terminal domain-containing protein [Acidimicrobiales bacterium]
AEAVFAVRDEMAGSLEDVLSRRTRALLLDAEATRRSAPAVCRLVGDELGWDDARRAGELARFEQLAGSTAAPGHDGAGR